MKTRGILITLAVATLLGGCQSSNQQTAEQPAQSGASAGQGCAPALNGLRWSQRLARTLQKELRPKHPKGRDVGGRD